MFDAPQDNKNVVLTWVIQFLSMLPGVLANEVNFNELESVVLAVEAALPLTSSLHDRFIAAVLAIVADETKIFIDPVFSGLAIKILNLMANFVGA